LLTLVDDLLIVTQWKWACVFILVEGTGVVGKSCYNSELY